MAYRTIKVEGSDLLEILGNVSNIFSDSTDYKDYSISIYLIKRGLQEDWNGEIILRDEQENPEGRKPPIERPELL